MNFLRGLTNRLAACEIAKAGGEGAAGGGGGGGIFLEFIELQSVLLIENMCTEAEPTEALHFLPSALDLSLRAICDKIAQFIPHSPTADFDWAPVVLRVRCAKRGRARCGPCVGWRASFSLPTLPFPFSERN